LGPGRRCVLKKRIFSQCHISLRPIKAKKDRETGKPGDKDSQGRRRGGKKQRKKKEVRNILA